MYSLRTFVSRNSYHPVEPFLGSVACVLLPTFLRFILKGQLGDALPFTFYFPTVLFAGLMWGPRWGLTVVLASGAAASALFGKLPALIALDKQWLAALFMLVICGGLVVWTANELRRALQALNAATVADDLRKTELAHRLRNVLAIVSSFSYHLSRQTNNTAELHKLLEEKILALAHASNIFFTSSPDDCPLPSTAQAALAPFSEGNRISLTGPEVHLDPSSCQPLVLALYELATNAHKYGALSVPCGRVSLSWALHDGLFCKVRWVETGGPVVKEPTRSGLGSHLLKRQQGLHSVVLVYEPTGLICEMEVPLG